MFSLRKMLEFYKLVLLFTKYFKDEHNKSKKYKAKYKTLRDSFVCEEPLRQSVELYKLASNAEVT